MLKMDFYTFWSIVSLTKCMALDLSIDGIKVNSISPGCMGVDTRSGETC